MERKSLCIATRNANKVEEMTPFLSQFWDVKSALDYPEIPDVEETGTTFQANADLKAIAISAALPVVVLSDDSGLEVDVLEGAPGVYSARYAGPEKDDAANNARLLEELAALGAMTRGQRRARFRCVLSLAKGGKVIQNFEGVCQGIIVKEPRGTAGFGYDPLFLPDGFDSTLAEMGMDRKNRISHRWRALQAFYIWCKYRGSKLLSEA
ncbi:non-canonical purine NTP pyrophosphatase, RdgB/HAM1 family [Verrucomicrobia bacterium LW23]|nr:non-canonical purine NTP pyrophosphatase, RdgB/HAM1 family [Verrucomicrobia bacterium LW23]